MSIYELKAAHAWSDFWVLPTYGPGDGCPNDEATDFEVVAR